MSVEQLERRLRGLPYYTLPYYTLPHYTSLRGLDASSQFRDPIVKGVEPRVIHVE